MTDMLRAGGLPEALGMGIEARGEGWLEMSMQVDEQHLRPGDETGIHAGAVISLADTACGNGCMGNLPEGASSFTTIELKSNLLSSVGEGGALNCHAAAVHMGRTTQVWQAVVTDKETGKKVALFQCTQLILYPRS